VTPLTRRGFLSPPRCCWRRARAVADSAAAHQNVLCGASPASAPTFKEGQNKVKLQVNGRDICMRHRRFEIRGV
jgi:hypothetical protein